MCVCVCVCVNSLGPEDVSIRRFLGGGGVPKLGHESRQAHPLGSAPIPAYINNSICEANEISAHRLLGGKINYWSDFRTSVACDKLALDIFSSGLLTMWPILRWAILTFTPDHGHQHSAISTWNFSSRSCWAVLNCLVILPVASNLSEFSC